MSITCAPSDVRASTRRKRRMISPSYLRQRSTSCYAWNNVCTFEITEIRGFKSAILPIKGCNTTRHLPKNERHYKYTFKGIGWVNVNRIHVG